MDHQWQPYSDAGTRQARFSHSTSQQQQQHLPSPGFGYESYQTPTIPSHSQSMAASPSSTPRHRGYSGDGDVAMEDADPYNRMKYPSRPTHSHRSSAQYIPQDDSAAARRYSPMKATTPSNYAVSPQQPTTASNSQYVSQNSSARQSPSRAHPSSQNYYSTPSMSTAIPIQQGIHNFTTDDNANAASSRQQPLHLPPIQAGDSLSDQFYPNSATAQLHAVFGKEARSPRHPRLSQQAPFDTPRGPVPRFQRLERSSDLDPRINAQPAFRRANPEGGFISVRLVSSIIQYTLSHNAAIATASLDNASSCNIPDM